MIQVLQKQVTFEEFIPWYPENSNRRPGIEVGENGGFSGSKRSGM